MSISNLVNRATLEGNGVTTVLPLNFPFHTTSDLVVVQTVIATGAESTLVLDSDYTVSGAQNDAGQFPTGGNITFAVAPPSTVRLVAYRDPAMLQGVVLQETGKIPVKAAIESPLDKLTMVDQRLSERIDRALRLSDGDSTPLGRLPAKTVRASRYLGFDGDGNPTMMQTPTGMVSPIAQLTESTIAALPAAGAAGSLRKVTDGIRGVWMDTGSQWSAVNGGTTNVKDFGAKGDGVTNDTLAIQAALDAATKHLVFPPGTYVSGNLTITNKTNLLIAGPGAVINWTGTAGGGTYIGFQYVGTCSNVTIRDLYLNGDGVAVNGHAGVWMASGQTLSDIKTLFNTITNVVIGVSYNAATGTFLKGTIAGNTLSRIVGTATGQGYGIHLDNALGIRVFENHIHRADRHSIYHAAGDTGSVIHNNLITDHRIDAAAALYRAAIAVTRSSNVAVLGNTITGHSDGAIGIEHDTEETKHAANILVAGNCVANRRNTIQDLFIGEELVPGTYETTFITVRDNTFFNIYANCGTAGAVIVRNGRQISIKGNTFKTTGISGTARFIELGHDSYITNDADCEDTIIEDNDIYAEGSVLTDLRIIEYCGDISTNTSRHRARRNEAPVTSVLHYFDSTQTNPNVLCAGPSGAVKGLYTATDTTPSVRGITMMYIANAGAVSITTFDDGEDGQVINLIFGDANTTVVDGASIQLAGGANFTSAANKTLVLVKYNTTWFQIGGSTN